MTFLYLCLISFNTPHERVLAKLGRHGRANFSMSRLRSAGSPARSCSRRWQRPNMRTLRGQKGCERHGLNETSRYGDRDDGRMRRPWSASAPPREATRRQLFSRARLPHSVDWVSIITIKAGILQPRSPMPHPPAPLSHPSRLGATGNNAAVYHPFVPQLVDSS